MSFSDDDFCGTIELDHFCGVCICGEESVDLLYTAILFDYYSSPSHYIHMVITKNVETHKTVSHAVLFYLPVGEYTIQHITHAEEVGHAGA